MDGGLDTTTKVQIAQGIRKGKSLLMGCKGKKTDGGVTKAPMPIVGIVGLAGLGLAMSSIYLSGFVVVDVAGGFLCFFAPYMVYQKGVLRKLGSFRQLLNDLRAQINDLMVENDKLKASVDQLSVNVDELEKVEEELSLLVQSNNIDRLVEVVKKTKEVNEKMRRNTQSQIVQQLITTVLRTDRDGDLKLNPIELRQLMLRLSNQDRFSFHRDRFENIVGDITEPVPVDKIMQVIRNLKDDTLTEDENVFSIQV